MKLLLIVFFQLIILGVLGCHAQPSLPIGSEEEIKIMRKKVTENVYEVISSAKEFKALYAPHSEFIYYLNVNEQPPVFVATAYLHERYVLEYRVEFKFERETGRITGHDEPFLSLSEIVKVTREPNGRLRLKHGLSEIIKYDKWVKLHAAEGDFASIGISLNKDMPVDGFSAIRTATTRE